MVCFPQISFTDVDEIDIRQLCIGFPFLKILTVDHGAVKTGTSGMVDGIGALDFQVIKLPETILSQDIQDRVMGLDFLNPVLYPYFFYHQVLDTGKDPQDMLASRPVV